MKEIMRSEKEIKKAIKEINENNMLSYSYREDVISVLNWVLYNGKLDGLNKGEKE